MMISTSLRQLQEKPEKSFMLSAAIGKPPSAIALCHAAQRLGLVGWNTISPSGGNTSQRGGSTTGGSTGRDRQMDRR